MATEAVVMARRRAKHFHEVKCHVRSTFSHYTYAISAFIVAIMTCTVAPKAGADSIFFPPVYFAIANSGPNPQCAIDAEYQITARNSVDPTVLGFRWNDLLDPTSDAHLQGVQRFDNGSDSYLYVSKSQDGGSPGQLVIVKMGSRSGNGEIYGSNREQLSIFTFTAPPPNDGVVDFRSGTGFSNYKHPGGIALMDNLLAVGLEDPIGDYPKGRIDFYFVDSPLTFRYVNAIDRPTRKTSSVGLSRLNDGRYLVVASDNAPNKHVSLYRSRQISGLDASTEFDEVATFFESELDPGDNKYFQNVDLIKDCASGRIYLLLAFRDHDGWGGILGRKDKLARYEITNAASTPSIRKLGNQRVYCTFAMKRYCDLDAGFGAYVNPAGEIFYYATEKDNKGPRKSTNFAEFKPAP